MSEVRLRFRSYDMRPPPLTDLLFDAVFENTEQHALWFVLPQFLDQKELRLIAASVEIHELPGGGKVRIAHFMGGTSFQTLCLPSGATVKVRDLPITSAGRPSPSDLVVQALLAEQMRIGEQSAEEWLGVDMISSKNADVTGEPGVIIASKDSDGGKPIPVTLMGMRKLAVSVETK
jgi:hypothetical protein